jgi:hypothetical protein
MRKQKQREPAAVRRKEVSLTEAKLAVLCEVRSKTESPCHGRAVVEIRGVALCEPCAREQEAYFAIGELSQDETQGDSGGKLLVEALKRLRRERAGGTEGIAAGTHHRFPGVAETRPLTLTKG